MTLFELSIDQFDILNPLIITPQYQGGIYASNLLLDFTFAHLFLVHAPREVHRPCCNSLHGSHTRKYGYSLLG